MDLSHGSGCGCKIGPTDLHSILELVKTNAETKADDRVLVGSDTGDDAAVVKVSADIAIIQTTDFFTPILNDPYRFGQVAAANAISDVYAMGGQPLSALSLVAFPLNSLDRSILAAILQGATDKTTEAGISIVGGHSIDDAEPKFGLAVTGTIHPDRIIRNRGARSGDVLILTKPIGVGILTTAIKRGLISDDLADTAFQTMAKLNSGAAKVMQQHFDAVHAATDITGFGLLGHLYGMLKHSDVKAVIDFSSLPLLDGLDSLIAQKCWPGATGRNFNYVADHISFQVDETQKERVRLILCDPQTSGGVLMSVAGEDADAIIADLNHEGCLCAVKIGTIEKADNHTSIEVIDKQ